MATTKITDLTAYTDPVNTDVLPIVDVTSDVTKKVSIANVMKNASLGSAAAPGIAFDGDPNTGIYSPGANQVAITTDGTQRLLIDSAGAVTIAGDLTVNGTTTNINTQNLIVEDKNVVLGDVATPTDVTADGGGITLKGTTDKTINWVDATDAWTSSERFSYPTGSAAAPTLTFTGDTNTGIYSPGADQVAISTNGQGRLFIGTTGAVGINNSSPSVLFHVTGTTGYVLAADGTTSGTTLGVFSDASYTKLIAVNNARSSFAPLVLDGSDTRFLVSGTERLRITSTGALNFVGAGTAGSTQAVSFNGSAPVNSLVIDSSGRLGVGTSSPSNTLHIVDSSFAGNGTIRLGGGGAFTGYYSTIYQNSQSDGKLLFNSVAASGSVHGHQFQVDGTAAVTIDASRRVGIGTTSPSGRLHVIADANTTGAGLQTWGYDVNQPNYQLRLRTDVSAGVVKYNFNLLNQGTEYDANLVLDRGRVGIGTQSPRTTLDVASASSTAAYIGGTGNYSLRLGHDNTSASITSINAGTAYTDLTLNALNTVFATGSASLTERARIDSSGTFRVKGAGTAGVNDAVQLNGSAPANSLLLDASGRLLVGTSSASGSGTLLETGSSSSSSANLAIVKTNSGTANQDGQNLFFYNYGPSATGRNDGTSIGSIRFYASQPTSGAAQEAVGIYCSADGNQSGVYVPSRLIFTTGGTSSTSAVERMRINSSGITRFSDTGSYLNTASTAHEFSNSTNAIGLSVYSSNASFTDSVLQACAARNTSNSTYNLFKCSRVGVADVFIVRDSGNAQNANNSYTGTSDAKLKENIVDATPQWDDIKALQVRKFNFKEETGYSTHTQIGLIAQEVEAVSPGLVDEAIDRDAEGNDLGTVTKSVNYSVLYMKAVKALQEAMERIEQLEAKVAALESA